MHRKQIAGAVLAAALVVPAAAQAHVTVQPKQATAGAYTVEAVRVPTESDSASTTKVVVRFPAGFASVSYQSTPGWSVDVKTSKLATPIKTDDGEVTEGVDTITWTADTKDAEIAPGQFRDFPISVKIPDQPGTLTFKALQTYSDGEVVRWIGAPDADKPAPQVTVVAADAAAGAGAATTANASATPNAPAASSSDGASKGLGIAALVVAIAGVLLALAALVAGRRRSAVA
jgi:uncharacterized protein YcnI